MSQRLTDKVILITGAGSGMGRTMALHAARQAARLVLADLDPSAGEETLAQARRIGAQAIHVATDVSRSPQVEALVSTGLDRFGRLDACFNNAGIAAARAPLDELDEAAWDRTLSVNLTGVFLCLKHQLRAMKRQRGGAIVNNSSIGAHRGHPSWAGVCASKAGVEALTRVAAMEAVPFGIRVNAIAPGLIDTPANRRVMRPEELERRVQSEIPMRRLGSANEIAAAVEWLMSDDSSYTTGHVLVADGGLLA